MGILSFFSDIGKGLSTMLRSLRHLLFPPSCLFCGDLLQGSERYLCARCQMALPETLHFINETNTFESLFRTTIPFGDGVSLYRFSRHGALRPVLHAFKYHDNPDLAFYMGRILGERLQSSHRFDGVELLVPVPLHPRRERRRGYNQSYELCRGIADVMGLPISKDNLYRCRNTTSQTLLSGWDRLLAMQEAFALNDPAMFEGKHVLLVDDVVTTSATLRACCDALLPVDGITISMATLVISELSPRDNYRPKNR